MQSETRGSLYSYSNPGYEAEDTSSMKLQPNNNQKVLDEKSERSPTFVSRASGLFVPRFLVEVLAVAALSALAYYLRFNDSLIFKPHLYPVPCIDYIRNPYNDTLFQRPYDVSRDVFLYVLFAAPIGLFLLGETIRWALGIIATKMVMIGKCPLGQSVRRIIRITGCFYTGIVLTSIITDMLQLFISRPSPGFFELCLGNNTCPASGFIRTDNDFAGCIKTADKVKLYNLLRAFPAYRATLSAYAATFAGWYAHYLFEARGSFVLRPFLATGCVALAMMASLSDWAAGLVRWEDVAVGLALGTVLGVYMVCNVNWFVEEHDSDIMKLATLQAVIRKQVQVDDMLTNPRQYTREPPIRKLLPRVQAFNPGVHQPNNTHYNPSIVPSNGFQRSNTLPSNRGPYRTAPISGSPGSGILQRQSQPPIYAYGTSAF